MKEHVSHDPPGVCRRLDAREVQAVLQRGTIGCLAVARPGLSLVPVAYGLDGRDVVLRSTPGRDRAARISHLSASMAIDERDNNGDGRFVLVRGRLMAVLDMVEVVRLERLPLAHWATWHQHGGWLRLTVDDVLGYERHAAKDGAAGA